MFETAAEIKKKKKKKKQKNQSQGTSKSKSTGATVGSKRSVANGDGSGGGGGSGQSSIPASGAQPPHKRKKPTKKERQAAADNVEPVQTREQRLRAALAKSVMSGGGADKPAVKDDGAIDTAFLTCFCCILTRCDSFWVRLRSIHEVFWMISLCLRSLIHTQYPALDWSISHTQPALDWSSCCV